MMVGEVGSERCFGSIRCVLITGALFVASQLTIIYILVSAGVGDELLALQMTIKATEFSVILSNLSKLQLEAITAHFYFDILHPVWYSTFALCFTSFLLLKLKMAINCSLLMYMAIAMGALDTIENIIHIPLIFGRMDITTAWVVVSGICASLKWLIAIFFTVFISYLLFRYLLLKTNESRSV